MCLARPSTENYIRGPLLSYRTIPVVAIFAAVLLTGPKASAGDRSLFASMYSDAKPFLVAIANERHRSRPLSRVTGISVPHHLLAADLIARGLQAAAGTQYERIILMSPDHFSRSRRPMATTKRDIDTVFNPARNDQEATGTLLQTDDLFDDSDLFEKEHGIAAILPFVRHYFPHAKIVPIAISYSASRADCDRAVALIEKLTGPRTLVIQSTDYSHYLAADAARERDQETLNIIAANDADAVLRLLQPAHMDSKASQYLQMRLQAVMKSYATVIANRSSVHYGVTDTKTTSYIVTIYTEALPIGSELRYPDLQVLYFGGDTFIGRYFTPALANVEVAAAIVRAVKAITGGAPLIVNLEGVIMDEPPEGIGGDLHVMHASLAAPILKALNVKVAGLANNHSFDLGAAGVDETRSILRKAGIAPLGHDEIVDVGPFRLLGLNFVGKLDYHGYPVVKGSDLGEVCHLSGRPPLFALVHWGQEYMAEPGEAEYTTAQAMQACGIGAIIGAHPHRAARGIKAMQGGEYLLTYSLGNLLFDQTAERGSGALFEVRVFEQGSYATRLIPLPSLFDFGIEQLQIKQSPPVRARETNSARNRAN
jgi:poly-gamma-glutamate synthesis protein (capsule biosynthesis protein)